MYFLGLDIGTTRMKCGIYDEGGNPVYYDGCDYGTRVWGNEAYVDVEKIFEKSLVLLENAYKKYPFSSIAISSIGESFVLLDKDDNLLFSPMLYTDPRGEEEASELSRHTDKIYEISGVFPQSMYSAYKLLWIKKNHPEKYEIAEKVMLVGEYIGYRLTGVRAIDCSLAARTGIFDVKNLEFSKELCELCGIDHSLFSPVVRSGSVIAPFSPEIMEKIKADQEIKLVAGGHDQVCASIGAGAIEAGACADGMGTVECLVVPYEKPMASEEMGRCGYPDVPHGVEGLYCTYLLNYSCASLVNWWLDTSFKGYSESERYKAAESGFTDEPTGILVLPYFAGASTPYQNINAKGGILNLRLSDSPSRVYQGIFEGLAMEMKLNLELTGKHGINPRRIVATGGCSSSRKALQIKADILGVPVYSLKTREAGICGCAMLCCKAMTGQGLDTIADKFVKLDEPCMPREEISDLYAPIYEKYRALYTTVSKFY